MHAPRLSRRRDRAVPRPWRFVAIRVLLLCLLFGLNGKSLFAQTAATGALRGSLSDPSGGVLPGVSIKVTSTTTGETRTALTQGNGAYLIPLLSPGAYRVEASSKNFKTAVFEDVRVDVTETETLDIRLQIGSITETVTVKAEPPQLETTSSALGHVTDERMVENLPLVTRNYTQILGLSPGVSGEVNNSASIGRGDSSQSASTGGYSVGGNATNDNNFQMNGSQVNDLIGEGTISGGVPVPNPDSLQEFKVQVGQYDASYGRNAGANDYFLKQQGQPRGVLNQNQFGFTLGGPLRKDKAMFFVSYQGTRERDGLDSLIGCLTTGFLPPAGLLPNHSDGRTAVALAQAFNGQ